MKPLSNWGIPPRKGRNDANHNRYLRCPHCSSFPGKLSHDEVGRIAAEQLHKKQYSRAALFGSARSFPANTRRGEAFLRHCKEFGIEVDPVHIYRDEGTAPGGYRMAKRFINSPDHPDVIFCDSDAVAFGAIRSLYEEGIYVPKDVELLSTDVTASDRSFYSVPSMSILQIPTDRIATAVIDTVKDQLTQNTPAPVHLTFPPELIIRESFRPQ